MQAGSADETKIYVTHKNSLPTFFLIGETKFHATSLSWKILHTIHMEKKKQYTKICVTCLLECEHRFLIDMLTIFTRDL